VTGFPHRITVKTPAKINLLLYIRGKRDDGFHDIVTVMQMVDLWDEIVLERDERLQLVCSDPNIPTGQENLICKAASSLKSYSGIEKGARITLHKYIPVAAGLGGGSSDAAATLFGLNILWGLGYNNSILSAIGGEIGSDVPFFFNGPVALGYGRGDRLIPLSRNGECWFLLINPGIQVSTAWAYSQVSEVLSGPVRGHRARQERIQHNTLDDSKWIGPFLKPKFGLTKGDNHIKIPLPDGVRQEGDRIWLYPFNDLEEVVIKRYPIIEYIKEKMVACGAIYSLMSGSGSTVFGIFRDRSSAEKAHERLQCNEWRLWVVRALQRSPYSFNNYQT